MFTDELYFIFLTSSSGEISTQLDLIKINWDEEKKKKLPVGRQTTILSEWSVYIWRQFGLLYGAFFLSSCYVRKCVKQFIKHSSSKPLILEKEIIYLSNCQLTLIVHPSDS